MEQEARSNGTCFFYEPSSEARRVLPKKKTFRATERDRQDVIEKETAFIEAVSKIPPEDLVFLDEAGSHLGMTRTHGRSLEGERATCKRSAAYKSNISLIGAVQLSGMCALYPYDGSIDGDKFLSFLDEHLIPVLPRGKVLIMDNLRVHHIAPVKERLEKAGIGLLYLPPYSPERNPIEETWSIIKRIFRSAEANNIVDFINTLKKAREAITPAKLAGLFRHAGYNQTA